MSQPNPSDAQQLSEAIAIARAERTTKADDLDRFRTVLLRERKAGAPVRALREGLAKIGVEVSEESLRLWLKAQGDPKQRKPASSSAKATPTPATTTPRKPAAAMSASVPTPPPAHRAHGPRVARDDI